MLDEYWKNWKKVWLRDEWNIYDWINWWLNERMIEGWMDIDDRMKGWLRDEWILMIEWINVWLDELMIAGWMDIDDWMN